MQTIQDRGYVWKKGQALVPSWSAFAVVQLLEGHFAAEVDYSFTARMENDLDEIATGARDRVPFLASARVRARFGNGTATAPGAAPTLIDHAIEAMANADPRWSTPSRSARTPTATRSSSATAATAPTSSGATTPRRCPEVPPPTS